jgi:hypothetical protein
MVSILLTAYKFPYIKRAGQRAHRTWTASEMIVCDDSAHVLI